MKIVRWAAVIAFFALSANLALADGTGDPRFQTIGGGGSIILTDVNDPAFQITYAAGITPTTACGPLGGIPGDPCIVQDFINLTGQTWTGISFLITAVSGPLVFTSDNAGDPYFTNTSVTTLEGQTLISFFGTDANHPGIQSATSCPDGPSTCTGPANFFPPGFFPEGYEGPGVPAFDFGILVDVVDAQAQGDSFTAQGSAAVPEPKSIVLMLAGAALVGYFLSKKAAA